MRALTFALLLASSSAAASDGPRRGISADAGLGLGMSYDTLWESTMRLLHAGAHYRFPIGISGGLVLHTGTNVDEFPSDYLFVGVEGRYYPLSRGWFDPYAGIAFGWSTLGVRPVDGDERWTGAVFLPRLGLSFVPTRVFAIGGFLEGTMGLWEQERCRPQYPNWVYSCMSHSNAAVLGGGVEASVRF